METLKQSTHSTSHVCAGCSKSQALIKKYQNLITLLKKKVNKAQSLSQSNVSLSSKNSIVEKTTSHTSFALADTKQHKQQFLMRILQIERKLKFQAFAQIKAESFYRNCQIAKRLITIFQSIQFSKIKHTFHLLVSYVQQNTDADAAENLKQSLRAKDSSRNPQNFVNSLNNQKFKTQLKSKCTTLLNYQSMISLIKKDNLENQSLQDGQQSLQRSKRMNKSSFSSSTEYNMLVKRLFVLEHENFSYSQKIKKLDRSMQEALNRQIKDNRKKTQSLQMVAEEMQQKNDVIIDLQQKIAMLEDRHNYETNGMLEDDLTTFKKEIEKLEKVNIKLDNDLRIARQALNQNQEKLLENVGKIQSLSAEISQLKNQNFELKTKSQRVDKLHSIFNKSCQKLQKLITNTKNTQKSLLSSLKKMKTKGWQQSPSNSTTATLATPSTPQNLIETISDQLSQAVKDEYSFKQQLLFIYLYNIEQSTDSEYDHSQQIRNHFDEQQLQVLSQLKNRIDTLKQQLQQQIHLMEPIQAKCLDRKQSKQKSKLFCQQHDGDEDISIINSNSIKSKNKSNSKRTIEKQIRLPFSDVNLPQNQQQQQCQQNGQKQNNGNLGEESFYGSANGQNFVDGSIFDVLNEVVPPNIRNLKSENVNDSTPEYMKTANRTTHANRTEPEANLTMKLLLMEIQKNKLIQKISELKEKVMHIRNVILNLIRTLEIKLPLKTETQGVIQILFDVFEYSEEEKQQMFQVNKVKEKKFFGVF